jgi:hypothetical protein
MTISVVSSPARVYIEIKFWNIVVITPTPVIIARTIPTTFPQTPPPAAPEKQIDIDVRGNINIVRIR